jgi:hypothetical protein
MLDVAGSNLRQPPLLAPAFPAAPLAPENPRFAVPLFEPRLNPLLNPPGDPLDPAKRVLAARPADIDVDMEGEE